MGAAPAHGRVLTQHTHGIASFEPGCKCVVCVCVCGGEVPTCIFTLLPGSFKTPYFYRVKSGQQTSSNLFNPVKPRQPRSSPVKPGQPLSLALLSQQLRPQARIQLLTADGPSLASTSTQSKMVKPSQSKVENQTHFGACSVSSSGPRRASSSSRRMVPRSKHTSAAAAAHL